MSDLDYSPGLREASAWLCLRQDIYISMVNQTPLKTELSAFEQLDTLLRRTDDFAYAAAMVLLLARVMTCAFAEPSADKLEGLEKLRAEVDEWFDKKPSSFRPIRQVPRDLNAGRALPELWLLLPCHVIGLQYYHIAQVVLLLIMPMEQSSGYGDLRRGSRKEATIRNHLRHIIALAQSNTRAENVLFSARHAISVWGGILRHYADQEAVESFLRHMQAITGWNTTPLISSLREQWNEN
ncbi:hypothetical protein M406DRAFT_335319 [Cryphonectria parasitica EP155]|uniref:Uncharacterized protein n=1 Tax=Cryphonectria parasitica (strain ATCC 38755 / EP155) TaxID=660469 RepID=A0A9P4YAD1_CRYP1|nr:uncharacterized protein M406DRAFT_335319 [Cryphonectria parasitica EP155]KAF3769418.1 hypothetical protein M406DRAFT_335319 [Cryphonectria parasitica EP155]